MSDTTDRAGESVLGSLLNFYTPELVTVVQARGIKWDDFGPERQQAVYRAILALHRSGVHVDVLTVEAFLLSHGWLERAGGAGFLAVCVASASPGALRDHATIVARAGHTSRLKSKTGALHEAALDEADGDKLAELYVAVGREIEVPPVTTPLRAIDGGRAA